MNFRLHTCEVARAWSASSKMRRPQSTSLQKTMELSLHKDRCAQFPTIIDLVFFMMQKVENALKRVRTPGQVAPIHLVKIQRQPASMRASTRRWFLCSAQKKEFRPDDDGLTHADSPNQQHS